MSPDESYLAPEARARRRIDEMLTAAGWAVQNYRQIALGAAHGVAVREFPMAPGHGRAVSQAPETLDLRPPGGVDTE